MDYLDKYGYAPDQQTIDAALASIVSNLNEFDSPEALKQCFAAMDLTTLKSNDTPASVLKLVGKVNGLPKAFPGYPAPASI